MSLACDRMYSFYANAWPEKCTNVPKLRSYIKFKICFKTEKYLTLNLNRNERSVMAQFRCGVLPLRVETGRFVGEQVSERLCKLCNRGCVEDETHFLLLRKRFKSFQLNRKLPCQLSVFSHQIF